MDELSLILLTSLQESLELPKDTLINQFNKVAFRVHVKSNSIEKLLSNWVLIKLLFIKFEFNLIFFAKKKNFVLDDTVGMKFNFFLKIPIRPG